MSLQPPDERASLGRLPSAVSARRRTRIGSTALAATNALGYEFVGDDAVERDAFAASYQADWGWLERKERAERGLFWSGLRASEPHERARALIERVSTRWKASRDEQQALAEWLDWIRELLVSGDVATTDALFEALRERETLPRAASTLLLALTRADRAVFRARESFAGRVVEWLVADGLARERAEAIVRGVRE